MLRWFALPCLAAACTTPLSTAEQPIIGGQAAPDDAAVALLVAYPPDRSTMFTCTAFVVAPRALVTAAHCLDHAQASYGVFWGADASTYDSLDALIPTLSPVASVHPHPAYNRAPPFHADIGVVVLAGATALAPLPFARQLPTPGSPARIVGYGQTEYGKYNATRRQAVTQFVKIDAGDTVTVGDAMHRTCIGDSGGPALVAIGGVETVIGVNSYADTTGCTEPAHFRRTDTYAAFIDQHAGTSPPPPDPEVPPTPEDPPDDGEAGGCGVTPTPGALGLALIALVIARRRRRR